MEHVEELTIHKGVATHYFCAKNICLKFSGMEENIISTMVLAGVILSVKSHS